MKPMEGETGSWEPPARSMGLLMWGYVVRIFPLIGMAGFALSAIGWATLSRRGLAFAAAFAGTLAVIAANVAAFLMPMARLPGNIANATATDVLPYVEGLANEYSSAQHLLVYAALGAGLLAESYGLQALRKFARPRLCALAAAALALYGALSIGRPFIDMAAVPGLNGVRQMILSGELANATAVMAKVNDVLGPQAYYGLAAFAASLVAYVLAALSLQGPRPAPS
ncbi:MAG: hypothetical protein ABWK00_05910 [Desulfurococcaceae archaeon]